MFLCHLALLADDSGHVGTQIPPPPNHLHSSSHICMVRACFLLSHANLWHAVGPLPGSHMWTTLEQEAHP